MLQHIISLNKRKEFLFSLFWLINLRILLLYQPMQITDIDEAMATAVDIGENDVRESCSLVPFVCSDISVSTR